ncbi:MAG: hypothetical protein Q4D16_10630 [Eubacteriales bacterium]|nr:hypothetical protein [Eubacteriales bacterium]
MGNKISVETFRQAMNDTTIRTLNYGAEHDLNLLYAIYDGKKR